MPINNPARLLTNYKKQREFQSRIDLGIKTLEDFNRETANLRNNHLQTLLKYSVDALTCLRSKEDFYIKASEYAIDQMKKTPLGELIDKMLGHGFQMWFAALKAANETFQLQDAIVAATKVCEKLAPLYKKALIDHEFKPARMGQGVISHMLLNQDAYAGFSPEALRQVSAELLQNGKALVSALEFMIVAGIESIMILPDLEKEVDDLDNRIEDADAFLKIFNFSTKSVLQLLQVEVKKSNPTSNLDNLIRLRDTWAAWADVSPARTDAAYYLQKARASE